MNTSAIIVCAGNSSRMQGVNKILLPLGKTNVIGCTLTAFQKCESITDITKLHGFAQGGSTRQQSVINGLRKISPDTEMIAVHDGARPLVNPAHIEKTIKDASVFGGAVLGVPVKDTIKIVHDGLIEDTPHRPSLYITQTPQVFKRRLYFEGVDFALEHELDFTDDCQLMEAIGVKVCMTTGDYKNIKITTPEDIKIAQLLLQED